MHWFPQYERELFSAGQNWILQAPQPHTGVVMQQGMQAPHCGVLMSQISSQVIKHRRNQKPTCKKEAQYDWVTFVIRRDHEWRGQLLKFPDAPCWWRVNREVSDIKVLIFEVLTCSVVNCVVVDDDASFILPAPYIPLGSGKQRVHVAISQSQLKWPKNRILKYTVTSDADNKEVQAEALLQWLLFFGCMTWTHWTL